MAQFVDRFTLYWRGSLIALLALLGGLALWKGTLFASIVFVVIVVVFLLLFAL